MPKVDLAIEQIEQIRSALTHAEQQAAEWQPLVSVAQAYNVPVWALRYACYAGKVRFNAIRPGRGGLWLVHMPSFHAWHEEWQKHRRPRKPR